MNIFSLTISDSGSESPSDVQGIYFSVKLVRKKSDYFLLKGEFLCACHALPTVTLYIDTKENHQIHIFKQNYIK